MRSFSLIEMYLVDRPVAVDIVSLPKIPIVVPLALEVIEFLLLLLHRFCLAHHEGILLLKGSLPRSGTRPLVGILSIPRSFGPQQFGMRSAGTEYDTKKEGEEDGSFAEKGFANHTVHLVVGS
jgi:hypothetical protein